jgi:glutathione peroxidase-family protein
VSHVHCFYAKVISDWITHFCSDQGVLRDDSPALIVIGCAIGRKWWGVDAGVRKLYALAAGLVILAAGAATGVPAAASVTPAAPAAPAEAAPAACRHTFVPAYPWSSAFWTRAINSKPKPGVMILNVTGTGAGTAAVAHFQSLVNRARKAGVTVLGYSSTEYGQRPAAQVETDAKNYKAWYKVNGMFLDLTANTSGELGYYRTLASYIHKVSPGSVIWLNVGAYPARGYMSVGNVVVAFEGSYASYRSQQVPSWTSHYRARRFADVIYATPASDLIGAVSLSKRRHVGSLFVTNLAGSPDPYSALPSYWASEVSDVARSIAGCAG